MFTGIVEERGEVLGLADHRLTVASSIVTGDAAIGASIAVNGVCLTVVERTDSSLAFDVSEETFARTSLRRLGPGDPVNLERPVSLVARLGGHMVQGHVDGVGEVVAIEPQPEDGGAWLWVRVPEDLRRYVVHKGSISLDGISLTVAAQEDDRIGVALIPHTLEVTTLGVVRPGDPVNVEVDVIAKYVERLMERAE